MPGSRRGYVGRPGLPPAVATLVALGEITRRDRILDVGCGTGTDALTLASWGYRVVGVDPDARAIATARGRATRRGLWRRVQFEVLGGEKLRESRFGSKAFDVVLHTLVANNLRRGREGHFRSVAAAMRPDGLLVLHERLSSGWENAPPGRVVPLAAVRRHFDLTRSVTTHLAERPHAAGPAHAVVALWLGRPRTSVVAPERKGAGQSP